MEIIKNNNCFTFVIETLKLKGYKLPDSVNGLEYDKKHILQHYALYLQKNLHEIYISSFCVKIEEPTKGDILTHFKGVGFVVNKYTYTTLHRGKMRVYPISGNYKLWRVKNGW